MGLALETQGLDANLADPQEGYQGGHEVGCVGLRTLEPGVGEIKRMYLRPGRGAGLVRRMRGLENHTTQTGDALGFRLCSYGKQEKNIQRESGDGQGF